MNGLSKGKMQHLSCFYRYLVTSILVKYPMSISIVAFKTEYHSVFTALSCCFVHPKSQNPRIVTLFW